MRGFLQSGRCCVRRSAAGRVADDRHVEVAVRDAVGANGLDLVDVDRMREIELIRAAPPSPDPSSTSTMLPL
jgi:hypothetical protein